MNLSSLLNQHLKLPFVPRTIGLAFLLCGLLAVYFTTEQSLFDRWNQPGSEYGHGPLLIGVIVWLLFRERQRLIQVESKPCYWALLPAILLSMLWSAGYITQVNVVQQIALPCVIFFSVAALMGIPVARIVFFPLSLIVFALPVWNIFQPPLQNFAVTACAHIFSLLNTPVHINGNFISVTSGTFQIATGCSGLNLFLAAMILGILFAHLNFTLRRDQIIVVLLAILLGIVCNWVRITTIIWIAQLSNNIYHPIVQDHGWLGWVWFAVLFSVYLFFVNRLPFTVKRSHSNSNAMRQRAAPTKSQRLPITTLIGCMLAVYSTPLLSMYLLNKNRTDITQLVAPATLLGNSTHVIDDATAWHPDFHGATSELHLRLAANPVSFDLHLYLYAPQSHGVELIHFDNTIADGKHWRVAIPPHNVSNSANNWWKDVVVERHSANIRQSLLVRYWYSIAGSNTTHPINAKLLQLKGLVQNRADASLIAISSACMTQDCESAQKLLDEVTEAIAQRANNMITSTVNSR